MSIEWNEMGSRSIGRASGGVVCTVYFWSDHYRWSIHDLTNKVRVDTQKDWSSSEEAKQNAEIFMKILAGLST